MRIGIDARFLTHPQKGGFKTYTENLITALSEIDNLNSYFLYLDRSPAADTKLPDKSNFVYRILPGGNTLMGMPWREQITLPRFAARDNLDLLHSPCLTAPLRLNCASVVTIHDMIWRFPSKFASGKSGLGKRKLMQWYYQVVPGLAARQATSVITVSQAARMDIIKFLNFPLNKITVTHEAPGKIFRKLDNPELFLRIRQKYSLTSDFILTIGSADPRKNIYTAVKAFASLPQELRDQYQLAIVWTHNRLATELANKIEALND